MLEHERWLQIAREDLLASKALIKYDVPDLAEAKRAIVNAEKIFKFVLKKISQPDICQTSILSEK